MDKDKKEKGNNGGAIIVLTVIWGFAIYFFYNHWDNALNYASKSPLIASIIDFLW